MESEVAEMAGQVALLIGARPTDLLGLTHLTGLERLWIDHAILARVQELREERRPTSALEYVRRKRRGWAPPPGMVS